ncbi:hypothetical protein K469DRAFT_686440 [Zopfia rhizophila CBS 207.26]|uniref:Uncharacterized protein n=1 Tax=Zopfia rhizophila CBS 207.26 TaxID=1314779 RepID=A0A6A6EUH3_9PEZI|nr:hypothetical protein K469DRAFT_686440 [Zopfia rhizophila CBS 207.26]
MADTNPEFPASIKLDDPDWAGSYEHRLEVLSNILAYEPENDTFTLRANRLAQCYERVEEILAALLKHYNLNFDSEFQTDGTHKYHDNLISRFEEEGTPKELKSTLGNGMLQNILWDCKRFRNKHKEFKIGNADEAELKPFLDTAVNGLPLVVRGLKDACQKAKVMEEQV